MASKGVLWDTAISAERPIKVGGAFPDNIVPITVHEYIRNAVDKYKNEKALAVKREGEWKSWTFQEFYDQSIQFARASIHVGQKRFECTSILGFNAPEWFIADIGAIFGGAIACGIYTTNGPEACKYVLEHSVSTIVVVENDMQLKKVLQVRSQLPNIKAIVQYLGDVAPNDQGIYTWEAFMALGNNVPIERVHEIIKSQKPEQVCSLIYTSGTTGPPKAVMLSHDNCTWTSVALNTVIQTTPADIYLSYLPLSHIAAQLGDIYVPMGYGATVYFAQPDALKGSLAVTLKEVRPTVFLGVPRVWEKICDKMKEIGKANSTVKKYIASWARSVGLYGGYAQQRNQSLPWGWWLADTVVFTKVRQALGLDRARLLGSAAAPISKEVLEFFLSLNIPIYEVYGMSETTGPETANFREKVRLGSAGIALPGSDLKIFNPDAEGNGEIAWRGRHVFVGYLKNDQATEETIDAEGYLHSGDIGKIDEDGFLYITGRIKELIITAGGENIAPVLLEEEIKKEVGSVVSNVMAVGDKRKFLAAVITIRAQPKVNPLEGEYPFTDQIATGAIQTLEGLGINAKTIEEAQIDKDLHKWITQGINAANKRAISGAQQIRKFIIIDQDFTTENDTLTPSMKLKRRVVIQKYGALIDKMYEDAEREMGNA